MTETKVTWQAKEYTYREKSADWYWAVGIVAVSLTITAILFGNTLFGVVIILGSATLMLYASRKPSRLSCTVDRDGVRFGKNFYPYRSLDAFWIDEGSEPNRLLLKSLKKTSPLISVPIEKIEPNIIRAYLKDFMEEEEIHEPLSVRLMEFLGF